MKTNIVFLAIVIYMLPFYTLAQELPKKVKAAFEAKYPDAASVSWEVQSGDDFMVYFSYGENEKEALFKKDGSWVYTLTEQMVEDLPGCIQEFIDGEYIHVEVLSLRIYEDTKTESMHQVTISILEDEKKEEEWDDTLVSAKYLRLSFDDECVFISDEEVNF